MFYSDTGMDMMALGSKELNFKPYQPAAMSRTVNTELP